MGERELMKARADVARSRADLTATITQLKHRLKPATLASDAWRGVKDRSSEYSGKGVQAVAERPGLAGGAVAAVLLFLLRGPLAQLLSRAFGSGRDNPGEVKADLLHGDKDYDLTAPVVVTDKGTKK